MSGLEQHAGLVAALGVGEYCNIRYFIDSLATGADRSRSQVGLPLTTTLAADGAAGGMPTFE